MEAYKNPELPISERVEDLLSRMTLEEKVAQLCGDLPANVMTDGVVDHKKLAEGFKNGHGRFTQFSIVGLADSKRIAKIANEIQRFFVEETRLGIPVALQSENLCGYPAAGGTLFPAQINMGCTWEPELAKEMSGIIGEESRAVGISSAMSPVIDVAQDPRWGRTYETYGEDPYVISQFGINYVQGMQDKKVSCIAKHFLGYANTQGGINCAAFRAGSRELYEIYATPFEATAKEAGLDAVMCNYGEIDGLPVIDNPQIIGTLLRDTMGFEGVVTSDGAAVMKTFTDFKIGSTYEEAGYIAKKAGTDTEIPIGNAFRHLPEYVRAGKLDEACIDDSVRRVLTVKFKCGLFENPYCDEDAVPESFTTPEKSALSEEIAAKSIVLLKNDGVLPLKKGTKIALVGPHAASLRYPVSGYTYPAYIEMLQAGSQGQSVTIGGMADEEEAAKKKMGADSVFSSMYTALGERAKEKLRDMNTVLRNIGARSLKEVLEERFEVSYAEGCGITSEDKSGFADAIKAAELADVVIMACGGNSGWTNVTGGEGIDRQFIGLPGVQQELLEAVSTVGKPVIVILYGPQVFAVNWAEENCAAIIEAFMPGQYAGKVLSDILDGTVNPGGKLTMSVPRTTGQIPIYYNHRYGSGYDPERNVTGIFKGGYVTGESDPLYHFGYGLSYTSFKFSDFELSSDEVPTDGEINISCMVKNTGDRAGDEVVQFYTRFTDANVTRPIKQIVGFKRLTLEPGESKRVSLNLKMSQMGYYNENMEFVVEHGTMKVMVGDAENNLPLTGEFKITGEAVNVMGKRTYTAKVTVE